MKRFLLIFVLLLFISSTTYGATFFQTPSNGSASVNNEVNDDLYVAGRSVNVTSQINGDLLAAGGSINFSGVTAQSLFITAGNVVTSGTVNNDLRAAGGNLSISSVTGGDVLAFGETVSVTGGSIGRDLIAAAGSIDLNAPVSGKVLISGNEVTINAPIKGNVQIQAKDLRFGQKALIDGNVSYRSPKKAVFESGSSIKGKTVFQKTTNSRTGMLVFSLIFFVIRTVGLLILALALVYLLPVKSKEVVDLRKYWADFGIGFAVLASTPLAIILFIFSIVGWPFAIILMTLYSILLLISSAYAGVIVGALFTRFVIKVPHYEATWLEAVVGVLILSVIGIIPFIGWLIWFVFFVLALGKAITFDFHLAKKLMGKEI